MYDEVYENPLIQGLLKRLEELENKIKILESKQNITNNYYYNYPYPYNYNSYNISGFVGVN